MHEQRLDKTSDSEKIESMQLEMRDLRKMMEQLLLALGQSSSSSLKDDFIDRRKMSGDNLSYSHPPNRSVSQLIPAASDDRDDQQLQNIEEDSELAL